MALTHQGRWLPDFSNFFLRKHLPRPLNHCKTRTENSLLPVADSLTFASSNYTLQMLNKPTDFIPRHCNLIQRPCSVSSGISSAFIYEQERYKGEREKMNTGNVTCCTFALIDFAISHRCWSILLSSQFVTSLNVIERESWNAAYESYKSVALTLRDTVWFPRYTFAYFYPANLMDNRVSTREKFVAITHFQFSNQNRKL